TARHAVPRRRSVSHSGTASCRVSAAGKRSGAAITRPMDVMAVTLTPSHPRAPVLAARPAASGPRPHPAEPVRLLEDLQRRHRLPGADPERFGLIEPCVEVADQQFVGDAPVGTAAG